MATVRPAPVDQSRLYAPLSSAAPYPEGAAELNGVAPSPLVMTLAWQRAWPGAGDPQTSRSRRFAMPVSDGAAAAGMTDTAVRPSRDSPAANWTARRGRRTPTPREGVQGTPPP